MQTPQSIPPKPVSRLWHPERTRLPALHLPRRLFRRFIRLLARLLIGSLTHATIRGLENLPRSGPLLIVLNHLGEADIPAVLAVLPRPPEALGKLELIYEFPVLGQVMDWYGTIWVHRGHPDRRALDCAIQALADGRLLAIAPEGRYSLAHGLERGSSGAAFVALHAGVPLIPLALTGTENSRVYGSLRHLRRPHITVTVGAPIHLQPGRGVGPPALKAATETIMRSLAALLPPEYRGAYSSDAPAAGESSFVR